MSQNASAQKRHRQSEKRRAAGRAKKSTIRTFSKKAVAAAEKGDFEAAAKYEKVVQGLVDRAIKTSVFHPNTAARRKSRLAKRINSLKQVEA